MTVQNKWSCLVIGYETMSPIEIYCFIAQDCSVSWPLIGQQRPMLASDWLMMAQYSNGCARCHTTRSVSRMSRGHKHHCHDKSQNWSQTPIVSAAWNGPADGFQVLSRASIEIFPRYLVTTSIVRHLVTVCKMSSDIKHPDNSLYWSRGGGGSDDDVKLVTKNCQHIPSRR